MIHENVDISGSLKVSGSFSLPRHASSTDATATTGSMYHDTTDNVAKIYTGTEWVVVGEQAAPVSADIEYLLVAGGGGAGWDLTAGGGAGGLLSSSLSSVSSGSSFTITIGAGGAGYTSGDLSTANDGDDSTISGATISTITAIGGGGGARVGSGNDGGSGGGVGRGNAGTYSPGSGTSGQGNDGGADTNSPAGTGGGGAGAAGGTASGTANPSNGGNGGDGLASSITGTSVTYAGGGGGGGYYGSAGTGGSGGGGNGSGGNAQSNQENGEANKGGGAGGGGQNSPVAASGGSGVAIFAYNSGSFNCAGGIVGDAGNGRKYHQFNASDTFKVGSTSDFQIVTDNLVLHLDAGNFASRGASTWTDLSTNGVNQTVTGATLGANFYYNFDGSNDYITINQNGASASSGTAHSGYGSFTGAYNNPYTFEFWIKTTDTGGNNIFGQPIVGRDDGDLYGQISLRSNKLSFSLYNTSWQYVESTTSINDGSWHHCVVVHYANQTVDLYVDNSKEANGSSLALSTSRYLKMTTLMSGYTGEYMAGDLAQFRLYDTTLTAAQVAQNYNATKTNFV